MDSFRFEWDPEKAQSNLEKHGVSFDLATQVWRDPARQERYDRQVGGEHRLHMIGKVGRKTFLLVVHTVRQQDGSEVIRIISARVADRKEREKHD